ncbi:MAG: sigma-70 family RNA polymerase sigma factor [Planctomycetes bacterium]|nr:sigma-70 family RNA polymerase sigma factor [Planctomycetota bacterium]
MDSDRTPTAHLEELLSQLRAGDESARSALIEHTCERLRRLTRKLKHDFPVISRWEQTDDVFQQAAMRLHRSLVDVKPENTRAFMGLAAIQIRRELIDVTRKLKGPEGIAANYATDRVSKDDSGNPSPSYEKADDATSQTTLQQWTDFHKHVGQLPDDEREVFDLCYYQDLTRVDAASVLGISERTVKRRFQSAKLLLHQALGGAELD